MHELLEPLEKNFSKALKKQIKLTELTYFQLQLSEKSAVTMTQQSLYLLEKKLFSVRTTKFSARGLQVKGEGSEIIIQDERVKRILRVENPRKRSLFLNAIKKFLNP